MTIHLTGKITEDRRLLVDIPDDIPAGEVQLTLEVPQRLAVPNEATARARAKLAAAGVTFAKVGSPAAIPMSEDELIQLGTLPPGSPTIAELIDADRNEG